eukprot:10158892-Prorocentrum_lima.AAC.1
MAGWIHGMHAAISRQEGSPGLTLTFDLEKFYDRVDLKRLAAQSLAAGFPQHLLHRASLTYLSPRYLQWRSHACGPVQPTGSIVVGCSMATYLARA